MPAMPSFADTMAKGSMARSNLFAKSSKSGSLLGLLIIFNGSFFVGYLRQAILERGDGQEGFLGLSRTYDQQYLQHAKISCKIRVTHGFIRILRAGLECNSSLIVT
ncbi:hypothetical protein BDV28DRAFT_140874 [Aspergillus coremiiformis]|uniref:Uncharacterized protein n=1 Tax=Aspergillus coremiiformis TaxID=138285 RepID=A0A5N6YVX0_9EURO|nr:hypothetical protein BDV28DRAFT_140874 [Aspergillus coremiiformis]